MVNYFEKCQQCKPPTRHPGCQDHCQHYKEARSRFDADKERANADRGVDLYMKDSVNHNMDSLAKRQHRNRFYKSFRK